MHESCVCQHGEPCYHEAFVFSAGETGRGCVELCVYQGDGRLTRLAVSHFTSWRKAADASGAAGAKATRRARGFHKTVLIDRIVRHEHGLTIDCTGVAFLFFGSEVRMTAVDVDPVDPPQRFGDAAGAEYRRRYIRRFSARPAER